MAEEKKDVHLVIQDKEVWRSAKAKCAMNDLDLSTATEMLWKLWVKDKIELPRKGK